MKKYILILLGVLLITSCSNGLEKQAKEQLKKTMKELLKNPDSATLTNVKTELNNDSLCIIHFTCKAQNGFGGYTTSNYEYIYAKFNNKNDGSCYYKEGILDLDEKSSVIESAKDLDDSLSDIAKKNSKKDRSQDEIERDRVNSIYLMATGTLIFNGRKVKKETGEEIKLK